MNYVQKIRGNRILYFFDISVGNTYFCKTKKLLL